METHYSPIIRYNFKEIQGHSKSLCNKQNKKNNCIENHITQVYTLQLVKIMRVNI